MADEEELKVMKLEFDWLLREHVPKVLRHMDAILQECLMWLQFSSVSTSNKGQGDPPKPQDYFMLSTPNADLLKGYIAIEGEDISKADIKFRLPKVSNSGFRVFIRDSHPWRLQQIQDAINYLQLCTEKVEEMKNMNNYSSGREVSKIIDDIANCLTKGKNCLMVPKKMPVLDIINSSNQKSFKPSLPEDVASNFYINCDKLVLSVFTLITLPVPPQNPKQVMEGDQVGHTFEHNSKWMEINSHFEVDCSIPRLKDSVVLFTAALQICQQLKDKIVAFSILDSR
ncbi:protein rogdi homolog [Actinia tenebrosa]|uniref:Protein rogdi homolog n=1 Tax=Actinia tenebrosa TaxID=6105 RepID=A0A6P8HXP2_ACTTE|nr:protein rogdi homolog [Actinia tenebrosa]